MSKISGEDVARAVLAKAAAYDKSMPAPDPVVIMAWTEVLGDLDIRLALDAVTQHYKTESRRIMPADIRRLVKSPSKTLPYYRPMRDVIAELKAIDERHGIVWNDND